MKGRDKDETIRLRWFPGFCLSSSLRLKFAVWVKCLNDYLKFDRNVHFPLRTKHDNLGESLTFMHMVLYLCMHLSSRRTNICCQGPPVMCPGLDDNDRVLAALQFFQKSAVSFWRNEFEPILRNDVVQSLKRRTYLVSSKHLYYCCARYWTLP